MFERFDQSVVFDAAAGLHQKLADALEAYVELCHCVRGAEDEVAADGRCGIL